MATLTKSFFLMLMALAFTACATSNKVNKPDSDGLNSATNEEQQAPDTQFTRNYSDPKFGR